MTTYDSIGRAWDGGELKLLSGTEIDASHFAVVCTNNACSADGDVISGEAYIGVHDDTGHDQTRSFKWKFATFSKSGSTFTLRDSYGSWTTTSWTNSTVSTFTFDLNANGMSITVNSGDYLGILVERDYSTLKFYPAFGGVQQDATAYGYYSTTSSSPYSGVIFHEGDDTTDATDALVYGIYGYTSGSMQVPNTYGEDVYNACYIQYDDISVPGWFNYNGYIYISDILTSPYRAVYNVNTPWLQEITGVTTAEGVTQVFRNPANMDECYSVTFDSLFVSGSTKIVAQLTQCWYMDSYMDDKYVSTSGSDSNSGGAEWSAYRTISKGIAEVATGRTVYIESGVYYGETALNSINAECNLSPMAGGFTYDPANVMIITGSVDEAGHTAGDEVFNTGYMTIIDTQSTVASSGRCVAASIKTHTAVSNITFQVFRDGGTTWDLVGSAPFPTTAVDGWTTLFCDFDVVAGDILAVACPTSMEIYCDDASTGAAIQMHYPVISSSGDKVDFTDVTGVERLTLTAYIL